jgi:hypothetical protein
MWLKASSPKRFILARHCLTRANGFRISSHTPRGFLDERHAISMPARLTSEQEAMLNLLRSDPTDPSIPASLIESVRAQPAADLRAYRLKRIAYWRRYASSGCRSTSIA